jgi:hypothetical protein
MFAGVNKVFEDGAFNPQIDHTYHLTKMVAAHEQVEPGGQTAM